MHRALSWLQRAAAERSDDDIAFMSLWIAFNAAYAQDNGGNTDNASERQTFRTFVGEVCRLDVNKALVWQVFPGPIRMLLDNRYVFQPFWDALNNLDSDDSIPLTKGAVDFICDRRELRGTIANSLAMLQRLPADAVA